MSRWWVFALAILAFGVLLVQLSDQNDQAENTTTHVEVNEPDAFAKDVDYTFLRPDGTPHYHLLAEEIRQFDSEDLTRMTALELTLFNIEKPPWKVRANHGYIRKRANAEGVLKEVVYLREQVVLVQKTDNHGQLVMRSEAFYIYPDRQYAETDRDVIIDTEVGRTTAAGLKANLESGVLKLSSSATQRVHSIVLPEQFKKK